MCALLSVFTAQAASAQTSQPVLLSEATSTRALAVESVTHTREPFALNSIIPWGASRRTRIMLFAMNLSLRPGENLSSVVTARAEDATGRRYALKVEHLAPVPGQEWMSSVILRLSDDLGDVGDVLVWIAYHGVASNRVRVAIGRAGGGPPDDPGAAPTPPLLVSGRVLLNGLGLGETSVLVGGSMTATLKTSADGSYSFIAAPLSNLTLTPQSQFLDFDPPSRSYTKLKAGLSAVDFSARQGLRSISGIVTDEAGHPLEAMSVMLQDSAGTTIKTGKTDGSGSFTFTGVPVGFIYRVAAANTPVFSFKAINTEPLAVNTALTFKGERSLYSISGAVLNASGNGVGGVTVSLSGLGRQTTTQGAGLYTFGSVPAGFEYTVSVAKEFYDFDPTSRALDSLTGNRQQVDFNATQQSHDIQGLIHDEAGKELSNFTVRLIASGNFAPRTATTNEAGQFSFLDAPAGLTYTIGPVSDKIETFAPRKLAPLTMPVMLDIKTTRRLYTIKGRVADQTGPMAGVTVSLLELPGTKAITNASGDYSFSQLRAGQNYTLTPSVKDYKFFPENLTISNLDRDKETNFLALLNCILSGRVTDASGKGIFGITMALSGPKSSTLFTDSFGNFSFLINEAGDYTLTPAREQGYRIFTPQSLSFGGLKSSQTVNFTAVLTQTYSPSHVLEFDGTPMTVDYGGFWNPSRDLGHFFWELWAMPADKSSGGYMLSDGYGGAHAILFGFHSLGGSDPGHYKLSGNVWDTTKLVPFSSDEGPEPHEWGHYAVGWDGQYIVTYFNGVPVGRTPFNGPRRTPGQWRGGKRLLVGGSDHSNFAGRMAQVRGYEEKNPREGDGSDKTLPLTTFTPQTIFSTEGNLVSHFFSPGDPISDLSPSGQDGTPHLGIRRGTKFGVLAPCDGCPMPEFVIDPTAPDFSNPDNPGQPVAPVHAPPPAPANALVFDSFTRPNSTYILGGKGGLGSTEGGTFLPLAWRTNVDASLPQPFGILNGRAVLLANSTSVAWVEVGAVAANLEISVSRLARTMGTGQNTGLSFRVMDGSNFFFAYTSEGAVQSDPKKLTLGYYLNGVRTDLLTDATMPKNAWAILRVRSYADGRINVIVNGGVAFSLTSDVLANATGAGLYNNGSGLSLTNRWDSFTVSSAPPK